MVIRLEDALKLRTKRDLTAVQRLEKIVDELITTKFAGNNDTLSTDIPETLIGNARAMKIVQEKYLTAGWRVTMRFEQRDGAYVDVKPYRPRETDAPYDWRDR